MKTFNLLFVLSLTILSCNSNTRKEGVTVNSKSNLSLVKKKSIRVAAVQASLTAGAVNENLKIVERLTRDAFEQGAELVVLPEFFTTPPTPMEFDQDIVESIRPLIGEPLKLLQRLAKEYNGIVGGSFLAYHQAQVYNSFALVFPDGTYFVHNKDYPTLMENCYYTGGTDDGVFDTPIGRVGIAVCLEFYRTETARRMLDRVDIVIGGSSWPSKPKEGVTSKVLTTQLADFAKMLGVPVVHGNHSGQYQSKNTPWQFVGEAQIVLGTGDISERRSYTEGEGIVISDVKLGKVEAPTKPIPDRFWIYSKTRWKQWETSLSDPYRDFYENTTRPFTMDKWARYNP